MERLSSGKRINGAKDDAAGMSVVTRMKAQISSLNQAVRNANDGISLVSTFDGAADEIEDILIRMRELATLVQNGTYTESDDSNANLEFRALNSEIIRIQEKNEVQRVFGYCLDWYTNLLFSGGFQRGRCRIDRLWKLERQHPGNGRSRVDHARFGRGRQ